MENISREMDVPLIDLALLSAKSMEQLGENKSRLWFMIYYDNRDTVHLTHAGAQTIATIIMDNLNKTCMF